MPARFKQTGTQLLAQLRKPLQVTAIGLPKSGKTSLINMMLGKSLAPSELSASIIEIAYGAENRTIFELADGRQVVHDVPPSDAEIPLDVFRVRVETPAEPLFLKSYAEIRLSGNGS